MEGVSVQVPAAAMNLTPFDQAEMDATRMKRRVYDTLRKAADKQADGCVNCQLHSIWFCGSESQLFIVHLIAVYL